MKIKYGELPPKSLIDKLITVSFSTPKKNLSVYKFCIAISQYLDYIENEKNKLIMKYGEMGEDGLYYIKRGTTKEQVFFEKWKPIVDMEIDEEIPDIGLTEEDFYDENCQYSPYKEQWLNASEIATVLKFC